VRLRPPTSWHLATVCADGVCDAVGAKADRSTAGQSCERQVSEEEARALARQLNAVAWMETSSKDDFQGTSAPPVTSTSWLASTRLRFLPDLLTTGVQ